MEPPALWEASTNGVWIYLNSFYETVDEAKKAIAIGTQSRNSMGMMGIIIDIYAMAVSQH